MSGARIVLAFDFASPVASVALARAGETLSEFVELRRPGASDPLVLIHRVLEEGGLDIRRLGGVVALGGPGSFTGLRIACATAIGFAQAIGVPGTAVSTLEVLALAAPPELGTSRIRAVVDALRGEWYTQLFELWPGQDRRSAQPLEEPRIAQLAVLLEERDTPTIGYPASTRSRPNAASAASAAPPHGGSAHPFPSMEPLPLARVAAEHASLDRWPWDPTGLTRPHYLRSAAAVPSK